MSVTDQSLISDLLKRSYSGALTRSIYQDTTAFDMLPKWQGDVRGESIHTAVELSRSHGGGARTAGEFLPVDYPESFAQTSIDLKRWYYTISLDGMVLSMFKKGSGSFVDYLSLRMENAVRDASHNLNRICHMDGTGVLGVVNGASTTSTVTLKHVWPNGFAQANATPGTGTATSYSFGACQFLEENDSIGFATGSYVGSDWTIGSVTTARINSIDWDAQTITLDKAVTVADGDLIFFADSHSNSFNKEVQGFRHLIQGDAGKTIQGISTNNRRWRSTVIDKSTSPIAYDWSHVTRVISATKYKGTNTAGGVTLLMHPAMLEEHQRLVDPDIRYEEMSAQFSKNLVLPTFNVLGTKVPIRTTVHCGYQELLGINTNEMQRLELEPMGWDDRGGEIKQVQGKDAVYGFLKLYWALAMKSANKHCRFDGIQVDTEYVSTIMNSL